MFEDFPNLVKEKKAHTHTHTQVQEAQRVPNKMDPKSPTPSNIIIKVTTLKDKYKILKTTREKQVVTYKEAPVRLSSDFSTETFQARREWYEIFKMMKSKDLQPGTLYAARPPFKIEREIRSFPAKTKLKEFVNTRQLLQQMLKD